METVSPKRAQTRQRLLDAAFHVLAREGLAAASIEAIVAEAGFTRGAFYSNFATKEELFIAMVDSEMRKRLGEVGRAVAGMGQSEVPNPITAEFLARLLQQMIGDPETEREWQIILTEIELYGLRHPDAQYLAGPETDYIEDVASTLLPAIQELGIELKGDPTVLLPLLISGYLGAFRQALRSGSTGREEEIPLQLEGFAMLVERFIGKRTA